MKAIDLFAGAGGFTTGANMAAVQVVWAANHWPVAVEVHAKNHADTLHICQDLHQADWTQVPEHDLLLASPACQGHTHARGKERPHHDATRSTAWAVVSAAEYHRPSFAIVENVPEFLSWTLYPAWQSAMSALGYSISPHIIDAADHGVPQHRTRLFMVLSKSKNPIALKLPVRAYAAAGDVIQWDDHAWSDINKPGRSQKTLDRIENGRAQYGDRFVMPYYGSGSGLTGRSLSRPLGTVTTRDRWAVVSGDKMRMLQTPEYKKFMSFPDDYKLPKQRTTAIHLLGNAVCPVVARDIINEVKRVA